MSINALCDINPAKNCYWRLPSVQIQVLCQRAYSESSHKNTFSFSYIIMVQIVGLGPNYYLLLKLKRRFKKGIISLSIFGFVFLFFGYSHWCLVDALRACIISCVLSFVAVAITNERLDYQHQHHIFFQSWPSSENNKRIAIKTTRWW